MFETFDDKNMDLLFEDQDKCAEILKNDMDNQSLRRMYCRTNIIIIEGVLSVFKTFTYESYNITIYPVLKIIQALNLKSDVALFQNVINPEEAVLLCDDVPYVNSSGGIKLKSNNLSFITNFKFTFKMIEKVFKIDCNIDYSKTKEWNQLLNTVKIRNTLTHPKPNSILDISDENLKDCALSCQWLLDLSGGIFEKISDCIEKSEKECLENKEISMLIALGNSNSEDIESFIHEKKSNRKG